MIPVQLVFRRTQDRMTWHLEVFGKVVRRGGKSLRTTLGSDFLFCPVPGSVDPL